MFHSRIIGAKSSNLDAFFFDPDTLRYLLARNARGCDVTVIEGVMGYYDGLGLTSTRASTYEAARETESPVVLVVNARGAALSVLAAAEGFLRFAPDSGIRGVILNGCSAMSYGPLARELENRLGVRACGYLPRLPECALESRHLGLITADEVADLQEKLRKLAAEAEKTLDIPTLLELADAAPPLRFIPPALPEPGTSVRIGVARDRAFCFYYEDSLDLLRSWYPSARWRMSGSPTAYRVCTWAAATRSCTRRSWRKTMSYAGEFGRSYTRGCPVSPSAAVLCT